MLKHLIIISLLIFSFGSTFAYKELIIETRDSKPVRVIKVVLDGEHYVVSSVAEEGGATLKELTKKVGGDTAVNGVFFCPEDYSQCTTTHTISERVYMGNGEDRSTYRPDTSIRMIFGFDQTGKPILVQNNMGNMIDPGLRVKKNPETFNSLYFGLGNFPIFLYQGENVIQGYNNYIDSKMKTAGNKTFICSTEDKSTIYMGTIGNITIPEMSDYLKKNFDCRDAMNLDAGYSIGMIYDGFVLDQGKRTKIMDAYVVLTKDQYIQLTNTTPTFKTSFTPPSTYTLTDEDNKIIKNLYTTLQSYIKKNGDKQKRSFINILRAAATSPKVIANPRQLALIKDILRRLYVIGQL